MKRDQSLPIHNALPEIHDLVCSDMQQRKATGSDTTEVDIMSNNQSKQCQSYETMWDKAIVDAKAELVEAERRVNRLKAAVRIFQQNKRDGVPWPGSQGGRVG